jgi:hypothetical protein
MHLLDFPNELLDDVVANLSDYRDIHALRQTNKTLRHLATQHLCRNAARYDIFFCAAMIRLLRISRRKSDNWSGNFTRVVYRAAKGGRHQVIQMLINASGGVNTQQSFEGCSALQLASKGGDDGVVTYLLDVGAGTGDVYWLIKTAMQGGSQNGHDGAVELLLVAGTCTYQYS